MTDNSYVKFADHASSYLPAIEGSLWSDGPQTRSPAEDSLTFLRKVLQAQFHVPEFFWDKMGWDANGFFGSVENPLKGAAESHCQ